MKTRKVRQLKIECSDEFLERIKKERESRFMSLKVLATRALEAYIAVPEWQHRRARRNGTLGSGGSLARHVAEVLAQFPEPKQERVLEGLMLDLKYYRSARVGVKR